MDLIKKGNIGAAIDCLDQEMGTGCPVMTQINDIYQNVRGESEINAEGCCTGKDIG